MAKRPAFQFYPGDWLRDMALRSCSVAARGLWIDMLAMMHDGTPYGFLRVNGKKIDEETLARMVGAKKREVVGFLVELEAAGVLSRDEDGTVYSRRMIRDEATREARAAGGAKSADNPNVPRRRMAERISSEVSLPPSNGGSPSSSVAVAVAEEATEAFANANGPRPVVDNSEAASQQLANHAKPESEPPRTVLGYFMPILRKHGFDADVRDGSVLKAMFKKGARPDHVEGCIVGLASMRDRGELVESCGVPKGGKLNMRMLYAHSRGEYMPLARKAEDEYNRLQLVERKDARKRMTRLGDIALSLPTESEAAA